MIHTLIKSTYKKLLTEKNRDILRWIFLLAITIYLTATAMPPESLVERSMIRNVIFWIFNGMLILFLSVCLIINIIETVKRPDKKTIGDTVCCVLAVALGILFVSDCYNHTTFYSIRQFITNCFAS